MTVAESYGIFFGAPVKASASESPYKGLIEGHSGGCIAEGDTNSVRVHNVSDMFISKGHSRWCPAYFQSEQDMQRLSSSAVSPLDGSLPVI